jgi:pilus assembly protein CpaF
VPTSRPDIPAQPRSAPALAAAARPAPQITAPSPPPAIERPIEKPRPAPTPAAVARPAPMAAPAPARRPAAIAVDDQKRGKLTEVMRELATRLAASLGAEGGNVDATQEEDIWSRAESAAADLLDQLNADGSVPPGTDTEALLKDVVNETVGIGPLEELLHDESVREVSIPRHDRIFVDRGGQVQLGQKWFSSSEAVSRAVERLLQRAGRMADLHAARANGALVEARIDGGLLLTAALPPLAARGPAITIRRPRRNLTRIADLVSEGVVSQGMADFLELTLRNKRNMVVAGPAGSGRSTVLASLARALCEAGERVVVVEEAEELDLGEGPWMGLLGRGREARQAISYALRLKPDRLVVGDLRGPETLEMLGALAGGADGSLCSVVAGSPRDALARLESMARLAPEAPGPAALADEIGRAVQVIVQLGRTGDGESRVTEIAEVVPGAPGEPPTSQAVFSYKPDSAGGRFAPTGHVPAWAEGAPPSTFRA